MGELGALFNPGMRHEIAERQAKAARREEEGTADPGHLRIDLLSGIAVINLHPEARDDHSGDQDEATENATGSGETDGTDQSEQGTS